MVFAFLGLPSFVLADTAVSGAISSDTTWSSSGGVYVIDSSFSVATGTTLTIEPGTIIKAKTTYYGGPSIYGELVVLGTSELPIYFAAISDNRVGGDTNGDGPSVGVSGGWQGLFFKQGSTGIFDYANISYAGYGGYAYSNLNYVGIENDGGTLDIQHSNVRDNSRILFDWAIGYYPVGTGIYNKSGILSISDSVIDNNGSGIFSEFGDVTISNSIIKNNSIRGFGVVGGESITLLNNNFSGNKRTGNINITVKFIHNGNISNDINDRGFGVSGEIVEDTILNSNDLPLLIGGVSIPFGKTLTIEPGTIMKIGDGNGGGYIVVYGNLIAKGTGDLKIYFTSKKDDSVGGDTNGDGSDTIPGPKNWNAIFLESGSKADFDNVVVRYSGYNYNGEYLLGVATAIYQRGAEFLVLNSLFEQNFTTSIFQDAGTTTINHSELTNQNMGIWSRNGSITISQSSLHGNTGCAIYNQGSDIDPARVVSAQNNWWGDSSGPRDVSGSNPLGTGDCISGNILYDPFLTEDPLIEASPITTPDPVIIIPGIMGSAYKNDELVIDPILHTYDDLLATLVANGYKDGVDLFTFPYEWRDSNILSAAFLRNKINEVQTICNCDKVDLVAHSMGGLVARQYIQSNNYGDDVDQVIFLGTPHKGSVVDYIKWEAGQFVPEVFDSLMGLFFQAEALRNGYPNVFNYIHNRPIVSVQELLPTFDYLKDKDTGIVRTYPNNYPTNTFLQDLNTNIPDLLNTGLDVTNIVGNIGDDTVEKIRLIPSTHSGLWEHGEPDGFYVILGDNGLENGLGDGTVTIYGATLDNSITNENSSASHRRIPTVEENKIFNILTGKTSTTSIDNGFNISPKILMLQLLSPIDFVITAPDGNKIGKNFANGEEYNQILNAFYSGYETDEEYITILNPLDGEYKVEIQGTDNGGEYGVLTSFVSDEFATTTKTIGITEPNQITNLEVVVNNANPGGIALEKEVTLDVLINDINGAYNLNWIKDIKTRDFLIKQAKLIVKFENKKNGKYEKKVDKIIIKLLQKELDLLLKKSKISQEAYNIIKDDLNWLINNN